MFFGKHAGVFSIVEVYSNSSCSVLKQLMMFENRLYIALKPITSFIFKDRPIGKFTKAFFKPNHSLILPGFLAMKSFHPLYFFSDTGLFVWK